MLARLTQPITAQAQAWGAKAPFWAHVAKVAIARRLCPRKAHACVVTGLNGGHGSFELRWLPQRQLYSLWFNLHSTVYADIQPHLSDFAAGVNDIVSQAGGPPPGKKT